MSRRDKQADLRRRMAEARSKLASSQSNPRELEAAVGDVGKKRPLPPSTGGGGGGGILKKSKYTSERVKLEDAMNKVLGSIEYSETAAPVTSSVSAALSKEEDAAAVLPGGYGDSSSDDEGDGKAKAPPPAKYISDQKQSASPTISPLHNYNESAKFSANNNNKKLKYAKGEEKISIDDAEPMQQKVNKVQLKSSNGTKNGIGGHYAQTTKVEKETAISDDVWDEFNALLDDDEAKAANDLAMKAPPTKPEANNGKPPSTIEAAPKKPAKKKSKKKAKKRDQYDDNNIINDVEQASYEARLARLMLLKSKKKSQRKNSESDNAAALPAADEFYDPGLAFRQDGEDAQDGGEKEAIEYAPTSKSDESSTGGRGLSASSGGALLNAPRVSLGKILRNKRDQARQLSSRGKDASDETADGAWF